jgi:hypothetical protein
MLARGFSTTGGCRAGSTRPSSHTEKRGGPPALPECAGGGVGALRTVGAEGVDRTLAAAGGVGDAVSPAAPAPLFKGIFQERGADGARSGIALFWVGWLPRSLREPITTTRPGRESSLRAVGGGEAASVAGTGGVEPLPDAVGTSGMFSARVNRWFSSRTDPVRTGTAAGVGAVPPASARGPAGDVSRKLRIRFA